MYVICNVNNIINITHLRAYTNSFNNLQAPTLPVFPDFTSMSMEDFISLDLDALLAVDPPSDIVTTVPENAEVVKAKEMMAALQGLNLQSITNLPG